LTGVSRLFSPIALVPRHPVAVQGHTTPKQGMMRLENAGAELPS
jgi:hypothetical protein